MINTAWVAFIANIRYYACMLWLVGTAIVIMLASLSGVVIVWSGAGRWIEDRLEFITSLAAGVFLIVAVQLIRHTVNGSEELWQPLLFFLLGASIIYGLLRFVPGFHHHCQDGACEHEFSPTGILFSDGLHNVGDGLLLAASFQVSLTAGITAGIAVLIHELVQEVSEFFVLKASGFSTAQALAYNFAVSATILIGAVGGHVAVAETDFLREPLLAVAAGSFLVVVGHDFLPHSIRHTKNWRDLGNHLLWFAGGAVAMIAALAVSVH